MLTTSLSNPGKSLTAIYNRYYEIQNNVKNILKPLKKLKRAVDISNTEELTEEKVTELLKIVPNMHYERPFQRESHKYNFLLARNMYDELDLLANYYLIHKTTISDGQLALAAFFGGVSGCQTYGCDDNYSESSWKQQLSNLKEWVELKPSSKVAKIALASYYAEYAWHIRGSGYASTVSEEKWNIFKKYIELSRVELLKIEKIDRIYLEWYRAMIDIGIAQHWPEEDVLAIYNEGINKDKYYLPLYMSMSAYYSPRWYGSVKKLSDYIDEVVNMTKEELGETLYARINWSLNTNDMFTNGQADWARMKAGFDKIIKDYPDPWNINNYARFACRAKDWDTLNKLSKIIKDKPILVVWQSTTYYRDCVSVANYMVNENK